MKKFFRYFLLTILLGALVMPLAAKNSDKSSTAPKNNTKNNIYNPQPGDDVLDLSNYKHINEAKAQELAKQLDKMVILHNKRVRKSSTNRAPEPNKKSKECIDISSLGVISAKAKKRLQEDLQQLIRRHNQKIASSSQPPAPPTQRQ